MNEVMLKRVAGLKDNAGALAAHLMGGSGAWWAHSLKYDLLDELKAIPVFDREALGQQYKQAVDTPDKVYGSRDAQVAKVQSDWLSSLHQATILRHRTRVRHFAAAVSRALAHQQYTVDQLMRQISNMEASG